MIKEINGRHTCTLCGYEFSAMMGDNEIPKGCTCENIKEGDVELLEAAGVPEFPSKLEALQMAVRKALFHIVDHGKIELGTPQSKALIGALEESKKGKNHERIRS
jgi:hypothetical protein